MHIEKPMDYKTMMDTLDLFLDTYPFLTVTPFATSLYGKMIPMVRLGEEEAPKTVLYVGAHHGMEGITAALLLRFIKEYCEGMKTGAAVAGCRPRQLFSTRLLAIVPMLNPDGVDIALKGTAASPIPEKLLAMNNGSTDFTHWQANGRGVDLNHNYDAGFAEYKPLEREAGILGGGPTRYSGEAPESEPEVAALASYLRFDDSVSMILTLHTQGEEIYYTANGQCPPGAKSIARRLAEASGYTLAEPSGMASFGGLTDWAIGSLGIPSFTVECGKGVNPLPPLSLFSIYTVIRQMLFTAPFLV